VILCLAGWRLLPPRAAWLIGKAALGLRSGLPCDCQPWASGGNIIAVLKRTRLLSRGRQECYRIPALCPIEIDLQNDANFAEQAAGSGKTCGSVDALVKFLYVCRSPWCCCASCGSQRALNSPWDGCCARFRDNEVAGPKPRAKTFTARHLQVFILGLCHLRIRGP